MMESIVKDYSVSFKELEKKVFDYVCLLGRMITRQLLEDRDKELFKSRDRSEYRDKGTRQTSIKTVYGEVEYSRHVYRTTLEDGSGACIFLLDREMQMDKIGLISSNLAEKIAMTVTESPYRVAAETISETCGQTISAQGAWNLMQRLGEKISEEEKLEVSRMNADESTGTEVISVLFEEMDGIWLHMQDEHHKHMKKQEMKVFTMYEGWDAEKEKAGRSTLVGKSMLAGMEGSREFHEKIEAHIRKHYDADEIQQRVLNGDGGSWINDPYDSDVIFQLDRYHIQQEILRKIRDKKAQATIREYLEENKTDEMLNYIKIYADSVASNDEKDKASSNAMKLYEYLSNNREGLLPYQERGIRIPEPPKGVLYKNMGIQENQNCTTITMRMKHRRMRWSTKGANNLAKALYRKENRELVETIDRYTDGLVFSVRMQEVVREVLSAAKAPKKDGKGNPYAELLNRHMPLMDAMRTASRREFLHAILS